MVLTTSFEAIWMGVPVLTMASINKNLNMEQLLLKMRTIMYLKQLILNNKEKYLKFKKIVLQMQLKKKLLKKFQFNLLQ